MLLIDSDNAMGSAAGDVDDGLAVAALLKSGLPIAALTGRCGWCGASIRGRSGAGSSP